jgi:hypothetical protein
LAWISTPGLDAGGVTPELKLRLKFYCSWAWRVFVVCFLSCLFVHLSPLISLFFVVVVVVSFIIVN